MGRVSAHVNYLYDAQYGKETGFFGFFECEEDPWAAEVLFVAVKKYLKERGKTKILGPMNFGVYDEIGVLVRGFDSPPMVLNLLTHVNREAKIIDRIFKPAWSQNWSHVPWTDREFDRLVDAVKRIALPELSFVAEIQGQPVGIVLSIADANVAVKKINGRLFPFGFLNENRRKRSRLRIQGSEDVEHCRE